MSNVVDGHIVVQHHTGEGVTFNIRDVKHHDKLNVQLMSHVGTRETKRETLPLIHFQILLWMN